MTSGLPQTDTNWEWRETAAWVVTEIFAIAAYGLLAPAQVRYVQLPMDELTIGDFGFEVLLPLIGVFLAGGLAVYVVTLIAQRRLPRLWSRKRSRRPVDWTLFAGLIAGPIGGFLYHRSTQGLLVLNENTGAYVWAPPDVAGWAIAWLAFVGIGVAAARILQSIRDRRQGATTTVAPRPMTPLA